MKELKKVGKYQDPKIEVQLYNFRVNFISVVISTLGTISEKLEKKGTWKLLEMKPSIIFHRYKNFLFWKKFHLSKSAWHFLVVNLSREVVSIKILVSGNLKTQIQIVVQSLMETLKTTALTGLTWSTQSGSSISPSKGGSKSGEKVR